MPFLYAATEYRGEKCIEVTGFTGAAAALTVPDEIDGLPVRSIGKQAFAGRGDIREISLPRALRRLSLFAFHNCANLRKITLYDGVIRQCGALSEIELHTDGSSYALMKEMLEDNDHAISFHLHLPSEEIRLSFPDYALIASENTMARTIQFAYEGGGYAYRQCIRKKEIRYREYDRLFPFMEHDDPSFAAVIASDRLLFPHDLDETAKERYESFLRSHAALALDRFVRDSRIERVRLLTERGLADAEAISAALQTAAQRKETAICAVLIEGGRQNKSRGDESGSSLAGGDKALTLELEDW